MLYVLLCKIFINLLNILCLGVKTRGVRDVAIGMLGYICY